jgi:hypothetical protein
MGGCHCDADVITMLHAETEVFDPKADGWQPLRCIWDTVACLLSLHRIV